MKSTLTFAKQLERLPAVKQWKSAQLKQTNNRIESNSEEMTQTHTRTKEEKSF